MTWTHCCARLASRSPPEPGNENKILVAGRITAANSLTRNITLAALSAGAVYNYQLWCAGTAPTPTQQFRTP
jgi:hypothetical protein